MTSGIAAGHRPDDNDRFTASGVVVAMSKALLVFAEMVERKPGGAPEHIIGPLILLLSQMCRDANADRKLVHDALDRAWERGHNGLVHDVLDDLCVDKVAADIAEDAGG
jgi:hypothetical protein